MSKIPQSPRTCAVCGRKAATGRRTMLGWTGPECVRKVNALPDYFKAMGLSVLTELDGVIQFPIERVPYAGNSIGGKYGLISARLRKNHLDLKQVGGIDWTAEQPVITMRVVVKRPRKFHNAIKSHVEVRREFENRLKEGSARRAAARQYLVVSAECR